ncbi:MAG: hypothetical protein NTZ05_17400 [Chloroflexi bacterium]|nr:hypothetical protein [Chloroflexota bacterium]
MSRWLWPLPIIAMVTLMVWGFWFFRLRALPMPVAVRNDSAGVVTMYVNGVPARLLTSDKGCDGDGEARRDAAFTDKLAPGESGWFCRVRRGTRTGMRLCYEARTADGAVLSAVQWGSDEWAAHGFALEVQPNGGRRECSVTTAD